MKSIIHIVGTQCSGKSHLLRELAKDHTFQTFCLAEDFYKSVGILNSSYVMDWDKYKKNIDKLPAALERFFETAEVPVIESSGINKTLNGILESYDVNVIALEPPDDFELKSRVLERNLKLSVARKMAREFEKAGYKTYEYKEAKKIISGLLSWPTSIKKAAPAVKADVSALGKRWDPGIKEIMKHRKKLSKLDWKSNKFWKMHLNGYDPWSDCKGYYFDKETAIRVIEFWEDTFIHSSAEWKDQPFLLEPFQKQLIGHFFGWKNKKPVKDIATGEDLFLRRYREVFIYVPRKAGKTPLGVCMALILYMFDGEMGAEVDIMAADKQQASIAWGDLQYNVENVDIFEDLKLYTSLKSVEDKETNSFARVLSADGDTKHGYRPSCYIIDELHLQKNENLMDVMETGTAARRQPTAIFITTADYDQPSPCNEKFDYFQKVRDGILSDPEALPMIYMADDSDDWEDEETWKKANPNYGICPKKDYFMRKVKRAKNNPRFLNTFKRLHLNIQTGQAVRWLSPDQWKLCAAKDFDYEKLKGSICYGGIDLASKIDITAFVLYFPDHKLFIPKFWVPEKQVKLKLEYQVWHAAGFLEMTTGVTTDYNFIQDSVIKAAEMYDVIDIAYDPYNASHLVTQLSEYDNIPMVQFNQNMKYFNEPSKMFEEMILNKTLRHNNNPVFNWMAGNVEVKEDPEGNFRPIKPHRSVSSKVDGVIAAIMALGVHINDDLDQYLNPVVSTARADLENEGNQVTDGTDFTAEEAMNNDEIWD